MPRFLTLEQAVERILQSDEEAEEEHELVIIPPEEHGNETENEEDDVGADLPRDVVGTLEVTVAEPIAATPDPTPGPSHAPDPTPGPSRAPVPARARPDPEEDRRWRVATKLNLQRTNPTFESLSEQHPLLVGKTCLDTLLLFMDNAFLDIIVRETRRYAAEVKNIHNFTFHRSELMSFIGVLLYSGFVKLPQERDYWSTSEEFSIPLIPKYMTRDRFLMIKKCLHFADNRHLVDSKVAKLLPIYEILNRNLQQFGVFTKKLSIDESMVPYYGRHSSKMFIRGKPIRFGYKVWAMCSTQGFPFRLEIYTGKKTAEHYAPAVSLGERVVRDMIGICDNAQNHEYYFDNFFTSVSFLEKLSEDGIRATGTIRRTRTSRCPLTEEKDFKKKDRGSYEQKGTEKVSVVAWNDNRVVTIASNFESCRPLAQCTRYSSAQKAKVQLPQPRLISSYNKSMGGVDVYDRLLSAYRPSIFGKKWWWPLWINAISTATIAAFRLHQSLNPESTMSHIEFLREVTVALIKKNEPRAQLGGGSYSSVNPSVRFDRTAHYLSTHEKQGRCNFCHKNTTKCCAKCAKHLHQKCFEPFHSR